MVNDSRVITYKGQSKDKTHTRQDKDSMVNDSRVITYKGQSKDKTHTRQDRDSDTQDRPQSCHQRWGLKMRQPIFSCEKQEVDTPKNVAIRHDPPPQKKARRKGKAKRQGKKKGQGKKMARQKRARQKKGKGKRQGERYGMVKGKAWQKVREDKAKDKAW